MVVNLTGHVFAVHGDLTRLACDAIVLPCDVDRYVTASWAPILPPGLSKHPYADWLQLPDDLVSAGPHLVIDDSRSPRIHAVVTAGDALDLGGLVARVREAVTYAAQSLREHQGRARPLVALPLVGTGEGGLAGRRGAVISQLLPELDAAARQAELDVALVLFDRRDFAAVQARRHGDEAWSALPGALKQEADRLGHLAARGGLSLFVGSGASVPLGLPDWVTLLTDLAAIAGVPIEIGPAQDLTELAEPVVDRLGPDRFAEEMVSRFALDRHALGHALMAGLGLPQMVTTNYDPCLELALDHVHGGSRRYRVLTRHLATGDMPWLLKLHGDIRRPESVVLTTSHYEELAAESSALHGVVQSLMLTSHLLFVGFSLTDKDFVDLASDVAKVRAQAEDRGERKAETALALTPRAIGTLDSDDLQVISMSRSDDLREAARTQEIFLDLLAFTASTADDQAVEYFLDPRYAEGFDDPADRHLRAVLESMIKAVGEKGRRSEAWEQVRDLLKRLGRDSADL